jgi:hypothetical protein
MRRCKCINCISTHTLTESLVCNLRVHLAGVCHVDCLNPKAASPSPPQVLPPSGRILPNDRRQQVIQIHNNVHPGVQSGGKIGCIG